MSKTGWLVCTSSLLLLAGAFVEAHENDPKSKPEPPIYGDIVRGDPNAEGAISGGFPAQNMIFCSQVPVNQLGGSGNGSDCWGYTSPSGREYAIVSTQTSCAWVEVSDPYSPDVIYTYDRGGTQSLWGDVKVIGDHAYLVGEGGGSIKIFDMGNIDAGSVSYLGQTSNDGTDATHNIAACPEVNLLAKCGGSSNGLRWYSTASNLSNPTYVGAFTDIYVHDAQIVRYPQDGPDSAYRGRIIGFLNGGFNGGSTDTSLWVVDFGTSSNFNPTGTVLDTISWSGAGYSHQGWADDSFTYYWSNDETALNSTHQTFNISDLNNVTFVGTLSNNNTSANNHNNYWKDGLMYAANYTSGLRVFETLSNGLIDEIAYFDTYPANDSAGFNGIWSVYPYFESGTLVLSDFQSGLIVVKLDISPVSISYPDGIPTNISTSGADIAVDVSVAGDGNVSSVEMDYAFAGSGSSGTVTASYGGGVWTATLPASPLCPDSVQFGFTVNLNSGEQFSDNAGPYTATVNDGFDVAASWNGNSSSGWTFGVAGDTAIDGQWDRGTPSGGGDRGDPSNDADGSGGCFLTDNVDGNSDVDDGITTLVSPVFDASSIDDPIVSYRRWYSNDNGADPNNDSMPIEMSNNGGSTWTLLEDVSENANAWVERSFRIADYMTPTSNMQLRFIARDLNDGSVIEAGIDDVRISGVICDKPENPPVNDQCADATVISDGVHDFITIDSGDSPFDVPVGCSTSGGPEFRSDVWFDYTAPCLGSVTISTCGTTNFDVRGAVYLSESGECPDFSVDPVACGDDDCGSDIQLQFVAFAGQQFKIRLGSNDGSEGTGQLLVDCESFGTPCPADLDNDGFVGGGDLGVLLSQFGSSGSADLDGSGTVDGGDIGLMLSVWGQCQG